ncbi:MAG TPA: hypothetical protein VN795_00290, partial [Stellaceae bacterium]|nr:hypothetical protein [Stellaceae bacterium]
IAMASDIGGGGAVGKLKGHYNFARADIGSIICKWHRILARTFSTRLMVCHAHYAYLTCADVILTRLDCARRATI